MADESPPTKLLSIEAALALVAANVTALPGEDVELEHCYGRFLAEDLHATIDLPPFASSAMDGYALRATEAPVRLRIVGESAAGSPYRGALRAGEAVVISTGAVVPADADAVVPLEDVTAVGDSEIELPAALEPGTFVRRRGSDIQRGERLLAAGTRLGPAQIGAAAAVGLASLRCGRRPSVAVLTTGSELRQAGDRLDEGDIYDANAPMLRAALLTSGARVEHVPAAAADTRDAHRAALAQALEHDVVVSSGGVSVGAHDLVRGIGGELGVREVFWRVALRPGKPLTFGVRGSTLVFGLPGNPVSSLVCFELFVRPALLGLQGAPTVRPPWRSGSLAVAVERNSQRDDLIRVRSDASGGSVVLSPLGGQQSHQIAVAAQADAVALIPAGEGGLPAGSPVAYLPLQAF